MATYTFNAYCDNSTLANFKAWAMGISAAFSTLGWVQTADTGQVNWSSISSVPSNAFVYEVWKSNDALSSTLPIYVKMHYGYNSPSAIYWGITVGTGSNGSGAITGQVISSGPWQNQSTGNNGTGTSTLFPCYFSGDAGNFRMAMFATSTTISPGGIVGIERSHDSSGNDTAAYVTIISAGNNSSSAGYQQVIFPTYVTTLETGVLGCFPANQGTGYFTLPNTVAAYPIFSTYGKLGAQLKDWMICFIPDVGVLTTVTVVSVYGTTHSYIAIPPGQLSGTAWNSFLMGSKWNSSSMNVCTLMRYE